MLGHNDDKHLVGGGVNQRDRLRPMPVTVTGRSCMSSLWIAATFVLLSGLIVAGGFPNWIKNRVEPGVQSRSLGNTLTRVDLGLFYVCYKLRDCGNANDDVCEDTCKLNRTCGCYTYMNYRPPNITITDSVETETGVVPLESVRDIVFLFSASIVYALGCLLLLISLLVGVVGYCKPRMGHCSLYLFGFVLQAVAGIALIVSLALFPVFFGSNFASQFCGSSADYYIRGQCTIDWSLFVAMVVTACTLYLPAFAIFSMNISDGLNAHLCC